MSWDISLVIDTGGEETAEVEDLGSLTYNVSPMLYAAIPLENGFRSLSGKLGSDALAIVRAAVSYLEDNRCEMSKLNPANGWGSVDSALTMLRQLQEACAKHPKATVSIT